MIGGRKTRSNKGKKRTPYKKKSAKFNAHDKLIKKKEFPSKNLVFEEWERPEGFWWHLKDANKTKYKKVAKKRLLISYMGGIIIPKGQNYYMHNNKILVGWHGTTNPPRGM